MAGIGADSMNTGLSPRTERWWTRARGVTPWSFTACSDITSIPDAPSEICDETAAVSRPPSSSGGSCAIFSSDVPRRGPSSAVTPSSGAISLSKRPSSCARIARSWLSSANASMSSREMFHFSAIISAPRNCEISWSPYRVAQPFDPENGSEKPNGSAAVIAAAIGIIVMFCTPPATITSFVPLMTACAAKCSACCDEPHCRSIVVPGTSSG